MRRESRCDAKAANVNGNRLNSGRALTMTTVKRLSRLEDFSVFGIGHRWCSSSARHCNGWTCSTWVNHGRCQCDRKRNFGRPLRTSSITGKTRRYLIRRGFGWIIIGRFFFRNGRWSEMRKKRKKTIFSFSFSFFFFVQLGCFHLSASPLSFSFLLSVSSAATKPILLKVKPRTDRADGREDEETQISLFFFFFFCSSNDIKIKEKFHLHLQIFFFWNFYQIRKKGRITRSERQLNYWKRFEQ